MSELRTDGRTRLETARLVSEGLTGGRGAAVAFRDIELRINGGRILTLLGPNGAGKTTLLLTLAGLLPPHSGVVKVDGVAVRSGRPAAANAAGIVLVPDNRSLFSTLTTEENLDVAARSGGPKPHELLDVFPALRRRWHLRAGSLSGGEQQMLAMARALIQQPKVLLLDELSMGLAPLVVESLFEAVRRIAESQACAVILVEQHVNLALDIADDAVVLNHGRVVLERAATSLRNEPDTLAHAYFGAADAEP